MYVVGGIVLYVYFVGAETIICVLDRGEALIYR